MEIFYTYTNSYNSKNQTQFLQNIIYNKKITIEFTYIQ